MIAIPYPPYLSPEDYLQLEEQNASKHEYIDGQVYGMAGTTDTHNTIVGNLYSLLRSHLRGTDYRAYFTDVKARLEQRNCFYYPDVLVTCDPRDRETPTYKRFPKLIAEVLSDSTEAFDRGDKFADYRTLDSLEEYVLIASKQQRVDCFRRNEAGLWVFQSYAAPVETFRLKSLGFEGTIAALYEEVTVPNPG